MRRVTKIGHCIHRLLIWETDVWIRKTKNSQHVNQRNRKRVRTCCPIFHQQQLNAVQYAFAKKAMYSTQFRKNVCFRKTVLATTVIRVTLTVNPSSTNATLAFAELVIGIALHSNVRLHVRAGETHISKLMTAKISISKVLHNFSFICDEPKVNFCSISFKVLAVTFCPRECLVVAKALLWPYKMSYVDRWVLRALNQCLCLLSDLMSKR